MTFTLSAPIAAPASRKLRRLFLDIETSPNVGLFWRAGYKLNIDSDNILDERAVICVGWKWAGEKEVYALTWDKNQNDKTLLKELIEVVNSADEIVAHNGDKFDMPWIKTRCLFHGIPTFPAHKTIDTLQWARRKFYFNSNKLNYIAKFLGLGGKIKTEFSLWKEVVLNKNAEALKSMVTYCKRDVELLEQVYNRLAEHCKPKTHVGVMSGLGKWSCPHCGSLRVHRNRIAVTSAGTVQHQMRCGKPGKTVSRTLFGCGRTFTINDASYKAFLDR